MITRLLQWIRRILYNDARESRAREFERFAKIAKSRGHEFFHRHFTNEAACERAKKK
jgi:hypothetical protein